MHVLVQRVTWFYCANEIIRILWEIQSLLVCIRLRLASIFYNGDYSVSLYIDQWHVAVCDGTDIQEREKKLIFTVTIL